MPRDPLASITVHQLQVFRSVAQAETLADAARSLGVSAPTLSEQLRLLERTLGARLLDRTRGRRGLELTDAGRALAAGCDTALDALEHAVEQMPSRSAPVAGTVNLACGSSFGGWILPGLYATFHEEHPGVELRVSTHQRPELLDVVHKEAPDLAVLLQPIAAPRMEMRPLGCHMDIVLVAPPGHPWAAAAPVPFAALADRPLVLSGHPSIQRTAIEGKAAELGVRLRVGWEVSNPDGRVHAALSGLGIALVSRDAAQQALTSGRLVELNVEGFPIRYEWHVAWWPQRLSAAAALFRDYLLERTAPPA